MIGGRKKLAVVILIAVVSAAVAAWAILSRSARQALIEEEVRRLVTEYPSAMHFEVKPETIEFLSLELVPVEESPLAEAIKINKNISDKVWMVEYECEGRVISILRSMTLPPFTRKLVRVVIDAYTGRRFSFHAENA